VSRPQTTREQAEQGLRDYAEKHGERSTRKAYASLGDDATFSRFVKIGKRKPDNPRLLESPRVVSPKRKAQFAAAQSIFHVRGVKRVDELKNLLVSGHCNVKIGRDVRKGRLFRGYWIYTLTLEERATCPRSCAHWETCYGNGMPFAKRVDHSDEAVLTARLAKEIEALCTPPRKTFAGRHNKQGILIRLHALGDFFSVTYVHFWKEMLRQYPNLAIFGYTAREPGDPIAASIALGKEEFGRRFAIRWSNGGGTEDCTVPITHDSERPDGAFICPEQLGLSDGCGKCGLCWNTTKNVAFLEH